MYKLDEKFIREMFRDTSRSIVGRLCKQNEILQDKNYLSETQKFDILKSFSRELIYEAFRDVENQIKCYSKGTKYSKYKVFKPTNTKIS